jgi:DNA end-binding protein Ku
VAIESARTIDIESVCAARRDRSPLQCALITWHGAVKVGTQAFAAIDKEGMVALGRVVLTTREHIIAPEPLGKSLMGTLLRYPDELRKADDYFDDGRENPKGHDGARHPHCEEQGGTLPPREVRRTTTTRRRLS